MNLCQTDRSGNGSIAGLYLQFILHVCDIHLTICTWCLIPSRFINFLIKVSSREGFQNHAERTCTFFLNIPSNICFTDSFVLRDCNCFFFQLAVSLFIPHVPFGHPYLSDFHLFPAFLTNLTSSVASRVHNFDAISSSRIVYDINLQMGVLCMDVLATEKVKAECNASSLNVTRFLLWAMSVPDEATCKIWEIVARKGRKRHSQFAFTSMFGVVEDLALLGLRNAAGVRKCYALPLESIVFLVPTGTSVKT